MAVNMQWLLKNAKPPCSKVSLNSFRGVLPLMKMMEALAALNIYYEINRRVLDNYYVTGGSSSPQFIYRPFCEGKSHSSHLQSFGQSLFFLGL